MRIECSVLNVVSSALLAPRKTLLALITNVAIPEVLKTSLSSIIVRLIFRRLRLVQKLKGQREGIENLEIQCPRSGMSRVAALSQPKAGNAQNVLLKI